MDSNSALSNAAVDTADAAQPDAPEPPPSARFGLKYRLLLAMLVCVVVPGVWLGHDMQRNLSARHIEELKRTSDVVAMLVANMRASTDVAQEFERGMLGRFVRQALELFPDIAYLIVTDAAGQVEYGRINPNLVQVPADLPPLAVLGYLAKPGTGKSDRLRVVRVQLTSEAEGTGRAAIAGQVKAAFSLLPLQRSLADIRNKSLLTLAVVVALGFLAATLLSRSIARPIERIAAAMGNVGRGRWERLDLRSKDEIGVMAHAYNRMIDGLEEGKHLEDRFRRYVPSEIVDEVLKQRDQLRLTGERREVTVLFSDIRGFTSMSELMTPDAVMQMLNDYFAATTPVILSHGGMLDKFIGDAIMAVWGAPLSCADQEAQAVAAAMDMLDALDQLNAHRLVEGKNAIEIGIGINSGVAVAGNVGTAQRLSYTVIGDVVNVAQRIESLCRQYPEAEFILGESTYLKVQQQLQGDPLPPLPVKGRAQPVCAYKMRRPKAALAFASPPATPLPDPGAET